MKQNKEVLEGAEEKNSASKAFDEERWRKINPWEDFLRRRRPPKQQ